MFNQGNEAYLTVYVCINGLENQDKEQNVEEKLNIFDLKHSSLSLRK